MGALETMDWELTTNHLIDRITALENNNRSQAQRFSDIQGAINIFDVKVTTVITDIGGCKKLVTSRFEHSDKVSETTFNDTDETLTTSNPIQLFVR